MESRLPSRPRDQAHTFQNLGPQVGRLLTVITPAGLERFFQVVAERGLGEDDLEEVVALAAGLDVEILEPPSERCAVQLSCWVMSSVSGRSDA